MSTLVDSLTASGGPESAGFLNKIIEGLWPNICVAGSQMTKDIVEPILASTLPGPLSSLRFTKLDFGKVPIRFSNVDVQKTTNQGIQLDLDLEWLGESDIELAGGHVPKLGIKKIQLTGRLSILLCPLTNVIPLIGAAQVTFINPPILNLEFTDAASIVDTPLIKKTVHNVILGIIESMAVLPNRFLVKLDNNNDFFNTYLPYLGILRLTIESASGIVDPEKSGAKKLLAKLVKDIPDCYVKVKIGADKDWKTKTEKNKLTPAWKEEHDFLVADYEQTIGLDLFDADVGGDDEMGSGSTTIKQLLVNGGTQDLSLTHKGTPTPVMLKISAKFFNLATTASLLSAESIKGLVKDQICGLVTILIGSVGNLQGPRDELNPSVKITWGDKKFQTAAKTYSPGTDIFNPAFDQAFTVPLTSELVTGAASFKLSLMNKKEEAGVVEVPFQEIMGATNMVKESNFDVGSGRTIRARFSINGIEAAK